MPSNLSATLLQDYISSYQGALDRNEQRPSFYGAMELFKKQTASPQGILDPTVKANIQKSFSQSVKVPVINYKDVSIGNVRTCALQTDGITSALVTLTAITYAWGFAMYPQMHYENYVSYSTAFNKNLDAGLQKVASTIDAGCVNTLEVNKNQLFGQPMLDYYPVTANAFQVPQASKNDMYNQIGSIMHTADFPTNVDIVLNPIGEGDVRRLAAQGAGNSINQSFQLFGYTWYPTNKIVNGSGAIQSTLYAVVPNSVALMSRNSPDAKAGSRIHESNYWDLFPNAPYVGMDLDVYYQAQCTDASALSGMSNYTQTKAESWQFSVDVFYLKAYNSSISTRYSPIFKFEVLA